MRDFLPYFLPHTVYICQHLAVAYLDNPTIVLWIGYVFIPLFDFLIPHDKINLSPEMTPAFEKDKRFLIPLYTFFVLDYASFIHSLYLASTGEIFKSALYFVVYVYSTGHFGGLGGVVGHELFHRRETVHKVFGTLMYSKMLYSHFFIEHTKGHHKHVATPNDPATSKLNESLPEFLIKTIPGSFKSVWEIETERL